MKAAPLSAVVGVLALAGLLGGCASAVPPSDPVYQRIGELQHQVDQLQRVVKGQGILNVASSQEQMTQQIADLQGQIQSLQHQLQQERQREQAIDQNFDQRLAALEGGKASALPPGNGGPQIGGMPTGTPGAAGPVAETAPAGGASANPSDYAAYQAAFAKLRAGNNAAAITAFTKFIQDYPSSRFVPNAWYWMAETHYVDGEYQQAIANFQQVLAKYPTSAKAPDSRLKIGYAQYALKDYKAARATFEAVIRQYPGTTPADLAKQRLRKMGSQGQ